MRITVATPGGNNAELEPLGHWRDATYLVPRMAALEQKLDRLLLAVPCPWPPSQ
jgi:hypothetical protein